ncbi:MAG: F0F1 ATP synthase subunit B [Eubacteriales bacterium]|nr:F0F1 ATP synthase subunit B [Eubacteriales bacterium]
MYVLDIQVHSVPDPINMILVWISVIILYFILRHFLHKPIREFLKKREDLILGNIAKAEAERAEAESLKADYEKLIAEAKEEGSEIVEDYKQRGESMRDKLVAEGQAEAKLIMERADREIVRRQEEAYSTVKAEAGDMAVKLAEKLLAEKLSDPAKKDAIIDGFISDLESK